MDKINNSNIQTQSDKNNSNDTDNYRNPLCLCFYKKPSLNNNYPKHPNSALFIKYQTQEYGLSNELIEMSFYFEDLLNNNYPKHPNSALFIKYQTQEYGLSNELIEMSFYFEDLFNKQKQANEYKIPIDINLNFPVTIQVFDLIMKAIFGQSIYVKMDQILEFFTLYEELGIFDENNCDKKIENFIKNALDNNNLNLYKVLDYSYRLNKTSLFKYCQQILEKANYECIYKDQELYGISAIAFDKIMTLMCLYYLTNKIQINKTQIKEIINHYCDYNFSNDIRCDIKKEDYIKKYLGNDNEDNKDDGNDDRVYIDYNYRDKVNDDDKTQNYLEELKSGLEDIKKSKKPLEDSAQNYLDKINDLRSKLDELKAKISLDTHQFKKNFISFDCFNIFWRY